MDDLFFNNPIFQGMDPIKRNFIMQFTKKDKPQNINDAMPFLMANMKLAQKDKIQFSHSEIQMIADLLCNDLPEKEKNKVKRVMSMLGHN